MADNITGRWLPVNLAVAELAISQRTLYRRIKAGHYRIRQVDGRTQVWLPTIVSAVLSRVTDTIVSEVPDMTAVADKDVTTTLTVADMADAITQAVEPLERALNQERLERQRALERASRAEQAATLWQERARNFEEETKRLSAQLALPPTQPEPVPATDSVEELRAKVDELTLQLQAQPDPAPRPWWQRWRR